MYDPLGYPFTHHHSLLVVVKSQKENHQCILLNSKLTISYYEIQDDIDPSSCTHMRTSVIYTPPYVQTVKVCKKRRKKKDGNPSRQTRRLLLLIRKHISPSHRYGSVV